MSNDILQDLGYLTLGSRLKRVAENLQTEVQKLMDDRGLGFQSGQFPLLAALDRHGDMTIGQIVSVLGIAQPGVTRNVKLLKALGLVQIAPSESDARSKIVSLTPKARVIVDDARQNLWPAIERCLGTICEGRASGLLANLEHLETELKQKSLAERCRAEMVVLDR